MKQGAADYLLKDGMGCLGSAIQYAIEKTDAQCLAVNLAAQRRNAGNFRGNCTTRLANP
jgi:hypothetical protein